MASARSSDEYEVAGYEVGLPLAGLRRRQASIGFKIVILKGLLMG